MVATPTQKERVLALLKERGQAGLTALESLELIGTMRLAAYVKFLKDDGYDITAETVKVPSGKHVARYRLVEATRANGTLFDISNDAARM